MFLKVLFWGFRPPELARPYEFVFQTLVEEFDASVRMHYDRYRYSMATSISIVLPRDEKERLSRLALRYGLSLPEFSRRILQEVASEIPAESFDDYEHPARLRASFKRALRDWKAERTRTRL